MSSAKSVKSQIKALAREVLTSPKYLYIQYKYHVVVGDKIVNPKNNNGYITAFCNKYFLEYKQSNNLKRLSGAKKIELLEALRIKVRVNQTHKINEHMEIVECEPTENETAPIKKCFTKEWENQVEEVVLDKCNHHVCCRCGFSTDPALDPNADYNEETGEYEGGAIMVESLIYKYNIGMLGYEPEQIKYECCSNCQIEEMGYLEELDEEELKTYGDEELLSLTPEQRRQYIKEVDLLDLCLEKVSENQKTIILNKIKKHDHVKVEKKIIKEKKTSKKIKKKGKKKCYHNINMDDFLKYPFELLEYKEYWKLDIEQKKSKNYILYKNFIVYDDEGNKTKKAFFKGHNIGNKWKNELVKPLKIAIADKTNPDDIVVKTEHDQGTFFGSVNKKTLLEWVKTDKRLYEVIEENNARNLYFDLDIESKEGRDIQVEFCKDIYKVLPEACLSISGSNHIYSKGAKKGMFKNSYHITVNNYHFKNLEHMKGKKDTGFWGWVLWLTKKYNIKENKHKRDFYKDFDGGIYDRNRCFKLVNQNKFKDRKEPRYQSVVIDNNLENHVVQLISKDSIEITNEFDEYKNQQDFLKTSEYSYTNKEGKTITKKTYLNYDPTSMSIDYKKINKTNKVQPDINIYSSTAKELLWGIDNKKLNKQLEWVVGLWYYSEDGDYEDFYKWGSQGYGFNQQFYHNWKATWEAYSSLECKVGRKQIKDIYIQQYGKIINYQLEEFKESLLWNKDAHKVVSGKYLEIDDFIKNKKKYQLFNLGMGKGKTYNIIKWLALPENRDKRVLWITNRKTLCRDIMGQFSDRNLDFNHYIDDKEVLVKTDFGDRMETIPLNYYQKLIIEVESLFKLNNSFLSPSDALIKMFFGEEKPKQRDYDIVIIDEVESIFNCFRTKATHGSNYMDTWYNFKHYIYQAQKVFLMDAYLSTRTINFCRDLQLEQYENKIQNLIKNEEYTEIAEVNNLKKNYDIKNDYYLIGSDKKIDKRINYHTHFLGWLDNLVKDLNAGKNIYLFYPYKTARGSVRKISIEDLGTLIMEYTGLTKKDIKIYHGDTSGKDKRKLGKVNDLWSKKRLIITNSCISVGVSFNRMNYFDKLYIGYDNFINPRDIIQTSFRIRRPKENIIEFYKFKTIDRRLKTTGEKIPSEKPCKEYGLVLNNLLKSLIVEEEGKDYEFLKYLFDITGYEFAKIKKITEEEHGDLQKKYNKIKKSINNKIKSGEIINIFNYKSIKAIWNTEKMKPNEEKKNEYEKLKFTDNSTLEQNLAVDRWYVDNIFYRKDRDVLDCSNEACEEFWKSPHQLKGFKTLFGTYNNTVLKYALKLKYHPYFYRHVSKERTDNPKYIFKPKNDLLHGNINNFIEYQTTPLTEEQKKEISDKLYLGKNINKSDYRIKKDIINHYFGVGTLQNYKNGDLYHIKKYGHEYMLSKKFNKMFILFCSSNYCYPSVKKQQEKAIIIQDIVRAKFNFSEYKELDFLDCGLYDDSDSDSDCDSDDEEVIEEFKVKIQTGNITVNFD